MLDAVAQFTSIAVGLATLITLIWTRIDAIAAAKRAEEAAGLASEHAIAAAVEVRAVAENIQKIELATNSMKDALVKATGEAAGLAGEQRGREQAAEARAKE